MGNIHLLSNAISNMIAAGEVVERPASVVKELIENSIDAKARHIDVIIKDSGRSLIEVIDDGIGMDKEDALMAFKRHATSKILNERDLFKIATLGFRGEALPSIAAVSKVEVITSTGDVGTYVLVVNSIIEKIEASSARKGTSIRVNELFYNTPVRLKHLKSDNVEFANIQETVCNVALGYPHIVFRLIHNDKEIFKTSGNDNILEIISTIYGVSTARNMLEVKFNDYDFKVNGYISKIQINRANRYSMITLLNGRYVKMNLANNAIIEAYKTFLPSDRYPISILNIEVDPFLVDINVHPSKHIVRLSKENELNKLIKEEVLKTLNLDIMPPSMEKSFTREPEVIRPVLNFDSINFIKEHKEPLAEVTTSYEVKKEIIDKSQVFENNDSKQNYFQIIGQHHGTYIIVQFDDGLYIIDQHAAAERINFEKFTKLLGSVHATIPLLIPLIIELSYKEVNLIFEKAEILRNLGIYIELFGDHAIRISEVPSYMQEVDMHLYASDIFELLIKNVTLSTADIRQHAIATIACKASIKANHVLTNFEMEHLIHQLFTCENPNTCPHGRPTMLKYTNYDLEKFFKRVG